MTVFLDHERRPFYAGTYFPPEPRSGMPSFRIVLEAISAAWEERRDDIANTAEQIATSLDRALPEVRTVDDQVVDRALASLRTAFDARFGDSAGRRFPQPMVHEFLLRHHARTGEESSLAMVERTLTAMAAGGMYDQLAGGFARYSVDAQWLIPHFEKMLYDNALLLRVYVHWWRETGSELARRVVSEMAEFLLDEMLTEQGMFCRLTGCGFRGPGGTFTSGPRRQVQEAGGDPAALGSRMRARSSTDVRAATTGYRRPPRERLGKSAPRVPAGRDDKVVLAWNAWAVSALAGGRPARRAEVGRCGRPLS